MIAFPGQLTTRNANACPTLVWRGTLVPRALSVYMTVSTRLQAIFGVTTS